ncbi:hypothetical protein B0H13DRAFT_740756 [Mycena leptocephala]|nr:hypothetical protein B0H13DRAFT_740756 [Mycena leptocephala]
MLDTIPPEIFAHILEIATEAWGIGFLPPICLVSSTCYDVVVSTPSLWGIIVVEKQSSVSLLNQQLAKAKATDLRITFSRKGWQNRSKNKHVQRFITDLVSLANNWVRVDMPTNLLSSTRWADMGRVEVLNLRLHGGTGNDADKFFDSSAGAAYTQPKLHSFTATGLPEEWVTRFLSPSITYFEFGRFGGWNERIPASMVQGYLSLTPNIHTLSLVALSFSPFSAAKNIVSLPNLHNLELTRVHDFTPLLLNMRAPALRTLTIRDSAGQMNSIFSQWSQPSFVPVHLQSLELSDCLSPTDTPLLIGWLARLPALVRLTISDSDEIGDPDAPTASPETDLFQALASPHGAGPVVGGWLCPSLAHLCLDVDTSLRTAHLLPIVRARGGATTQVPGVPARLRSMQGPLCCSGTAEELAELRSYFEEASDARCICLSCSFDLGATI